MALIELDYLKYLENIEIDIDEINPTETTVRSQNRMVAVSTKDERIKGTVKNLFARKYANKFFHLSTLPMCQFNFDLMYLKSFGDTISKLRLMFLLKYSKTLVSAVNNFNKDLAELDLHDLYQDAYFEDPHVKDMEIWRSFLAQLNTKFPNLRALKFVYPYECDYCPYFEAAIKPFPLLTHLTLGGRFKMSTVMEFLVNNPQIEHLNVSQSKNNCDHCDQSVLWDLPADFIEELDRVSPNLKSLTLAVPVKAKTSENKTMTHLKKLKSLKCNFHGADTWIPNLLAISGDQLEQLELELELPWDACFDFLTKNTQHLKKLKHIIVNGFIDVGGPNVSVPVEAFRVEAHKFISSAQKCLEKVTTRLQFWKQGKAIPQLTFDHPDQGNRFLHAIRDKIKGKINDYDWEVYGDINEVVFFKVFEK